MARNKVMDTLKSQLLTWAAVLLAGLADRLGRRRVFLLLLAGACVSTGATAWPR